MTNKEIIIEMPQKAKMILDILRENGHEGFIVGGCVRDSLMNRIPEDWDITTDAMPDEIKRIFRRTVDTGIEHGTVTVLMGDEAYEVTTYRTDGEYVDHRHPDSVIFAPSIEEDLARRDFTINAMAYNEEKHLLDLYGGISDLEKKTIKCVGNPVDRFEEDALRMLRAIRFSAQLGFELDADTKRALCELADSITYISAERIRQELSKLIISDYPQKFMELHECGICKYVLPEFETMLATAQNNIHHRYDVGNHSLHALYNIHEIWEKKKNEMESMESLEEKDLEKESIKESDENNIDEDFFSNKRKTALFYATLFHDIGKPAKKTTDEEGVDHFHGHASEGKMLLGKMLRRLKFDNDTVNMAKILVEHHENRHEGGKKGMRKLMNSVCGYMPYLFWLQEADILSQSDYMRQEKLEKLGKAKEIYQEIVKENDAVFLKDLKIDGKDLIDMGVESGPVIGEVLKRLLEEVWEDPDKNDREVLLKEAEVIICSTTTEKQ